MERKEEIFLTTLKLASKKGLSGVSLGQIAESMGIKKPSLYNHFASKEELIHEMYNYLRDRAQMKSNAKPIDFSEVIKNKTVNEILYGSVMNYISMTSEDDLYLFYCLIYQERSMRKEAAQIVLDETKRMILSVKSMFYALQVHKMLYFDNIDIAAVSYAMTMHSFVDYHCDSMQVEGISKIHEIKEYIDWFCIQFRYSKKEEVR